MYEVLISHEAEKYYKKLDRNTKERVNKAISSLSEEPLSGFHVKKLWGELEGMHRYAVGDLRIVYEKEHGLPIPPKNPNPKIVIQNDQKLVSV